MIKKSKLFRLFALLSLLTLAFPFGVLGAGATQTQSFYYTGGPQTWVVPNGVSSIKIEAYGAAGGADSAWNGAGGPGGYAAGDLAVTAGQTLYFYVGGQGGYCVAGWGGGYNGGGNAGYSGCSGGGGGGSDVRVGGTDISKRVIVAGGGGGGGQNPGYAGGGTSNLIGLFQGGNHPSDGGGGGGGYYGGNYGVSNSWWGGLSASDTGGYGGSSYTGGVTNGTQQAGVRYGQGLIVISWTLSDTIPPTGTIAYSTKAATNQNVVATLTPSEPVTITNNGGSASYTFTSNGSFTFEFKDAAGNTGSAVATVSNIDKVAPTGSIAYSTVDPTNQNVVATLTPSEPVTITNNGGSASYTFTDNGSFTFEFKDAAGNTGSAVATVSNIDKVAPTGSVAYSTIDPTNQNVVVTLTASEPVTITNNGGSASYTFSDNGSFTFEFKDAAGNTGSAAATVSNIDKVAPTGSIAYSTSDPTNQNVVVTLTTSEPVTITNNGGSASYTFADNGSFTFEFTDAAGNTGSAVATVSNIDKVAPTLSIVVDKPILSVPNHKLTPIEVTLQGNDAAGSGVKTIVLTSITSNESDNGLGDGNTTGDIQGASFGTTDTSFSLLAERSGKGNGRVYTITYTITDFAGNTNTATATVTVPKGSK